MSKKFIDFSTTVNPDAVKFVGGSPVHDGKIPGARKEIEAVRVDGSELIFTDPTIPDRLHQALLGGNQLIKRGGVFNDLGFVALMSGLEITSRAEMQTVEVVTDEALSMTDSDELDPNLPATLVACYHDDNRFTRSIVYPTHLKDERRYMTKLGDKGPVALASLTAFSRAYQAYMVAPVTEIRLEK